eukprot:TRINITY_DN4120_c0_g1_i2.p1 TRINITY_DN4120_c0_g1~~TRINITY_DN4120_c0_g1_i2.p1  ORF type:complete len:113 (-),score=33.95 TRINITY_DN4120_c0_g1_i2:173-511(-)
MDSGDARSARLAALRRFAEDQPAGDVKARDVDGDAEEEEEERSVIAKYDTPVIRFRNYTPKDEELKNQVVEKAPLPSVQAQPVLLEAAKANLNVGVSRFAWLLLSCRDSLLS